MSGFVRRAQRKVAKLEAELEAARAELARQIELDVTRAAQKAERVVAQKQARRAARAARHAEHPEEALSEAMGLLMDVHLKRGLRFNPACAEEFIRWKREAEFPPNTNLYQKVVQFIETQGDDNEPEPVPVFAKTLIGDLIPLEYRAEHDAQDMLRQLAAFDPEFRLGTVSIARAEENIGEPVEPSEIFFMYQNGTKLVTYRRESDFITHHNRIGYHFTVCPSGVTDQRHRDMDTHVNILYQPETQEISDYYHDAVPLSELRQFARDLIVGYDHRYDGSIAYYLTEEAQEELCAIFEAVRRDKSF